MNNNFYWKGWLALLAAALVVGSFVALASCSQGASVEQVGVEEIYDTGAGDGRRQ